MSPAELIAYVDLDKEDRNREEENNSEGKEGEDVVGEGNAEELDANDVMDVDGNTGQLKDSEVLEPYVGMEFESEDAARKFYIDYAKKVGFVVRIMQRRRSETDGRTLARRLGCNKQGFSPNNQGSVASGKRPRCSAREGCKATILVKMEKSGKWVVTRFVKDHNHPLIISARGVSNGVDKDKKIEQLTLELQRQDQLCTAYRNKLLNFLASVEEQGEHLSSKINGVIENVKKIEAEIQKSSGH
ncbi:protein FAR1-RELATED SEQUENCE 5-like isoform X2 [Coffea eugenioides]|uniref:Protein FAR1-RELATED SEQUENCE 2 isoform X2 n=1 Tax=Coffea arabica TaxID=13443 RepID=A0A6P6UPD0_COFAR|nr:protein FAR1-RELATED SEQUENCE 5-like isoform X2 [Coffea arabica]XP_027148773.1 protein FAR1-RELATED SEQUENCE 5-like isoform X2 [Coffea eugenioides]